MDRSIKRDSNKNDSNADLKRIARELLTPSEHFEGKAGQAKPNMIDALAMLGRLAEIAEKSVKPAATPQFTQSFGATPAKAAVAAPAPAKPAPKTEYRSEHSEYQPALRDPELIQALIGLCGKIPAVALQQPRLAPEPEHAAVATASASKPNLAGSHTVQEAPPCFEHSPTPAVNAAPKTSPLSARKTFRSTSAILKPTPS